jgi:hypothetical protein
VSAQALSPAFEIEITRQGWIDPDDPECADTDHCSHGDIRLTIDGVTICPGTDEGGWGISEGALALLRTLASDHSARADPFAERSRPRRRILRFARRAEPERAAPSEPRVAERLIPHGCGLILMMGCPIGIDWSVEHLGGRVRIRDVVKYDTIDVREAVRFPQIDVEVAEEEYRRQVIAFATRAKEPFQGIEKKFEGYFADHERREYEEFWAEYERLLSTFGQ